MHLTHLAGYLSLMGLIFGCIVYQGTHDRRHHGHEHAVPEGEDRRKH